MKREEISHAVGDIAGRHITESATEKGKRRPRRAVWMGAVAAVLAIAILCGVLFWPGGGTMKAYAIAQPEYPKMAPYPSNEWNESAYDKWRESRDRQRNQAEGYTDGLEEFYAATMAEFLSGTDGKNRVYAPLNIYLALGMLAECTDGQSRAQILDLLGVNNMGSLRTRARALWNANYCDDGSTTSVLASSLWLDQKTDFVQDIMDTLAKTYYASSFKGEMGSEEYNKTLQNWLDEQTRGLLTDQASGIELDRETILALATTVYFNARWSHEFDKGDTAPAVFHAPGGDVTRDFMHQTEQTNYYWGDQFGAVQRGFASGGTVWLLLPDEGVDVNDLLTDPQALALMTCNPNREQENSKFLKVNQSIPKFDVSGSVDLAGGLKRLGITDVFDPGVSDFTPMTRDRDDIYLSQATHAARVKLDEKGVEAAAFTVMGVTGAGMPPEEEVDFVLDRPFLFAITGVNGMLMFVGVVNDPMG